MRDLLGIVEAQNVAFAKPAVTGPSLTATHGKQQPRCGAVGCRSSRKAAGAFPVVACTPAGPVRVSIPKFRKMRTITVPVNGK